MSIAAILVGLALLIITVPIVAGPLLNHQRKEKHPANDGQKPMARNLYRQTLRQLGDLDFDHRLGVVNQEDYDSLRGRLLAEAAQARADEENNGEDDLDARIEAAARAYRRRMTEKPAAETLACHQCGAKMNPGDRFCTRCGSRTSPQCPGCGRQVSPADIYCVDCGMSLAVEMKA